MLYARYYQGTIHSKYIHRMYVTYHGKPSSIESNRQLFSYGNMQRSSVMDILRLIWFEKARSCLGIDHTNKKYYFGKLKFAKLLSGLLPFTRAFQRDTSLPSVANSLRISLKTVWYINRSSRRPSKNRKCCHEEAVLKFDLCPIQPSYFDTNGIYNDL